MPSQLSRGSLGPILIRLAIVGLRQDYVTSNVVGSPEENTKATTGRAGLMYELPFGLTPYVSYAQSFNPNFGSGACVGVCLASVYGFLLGLIRRTSGGLAAPIVTHFFADLTIFVLIAAHA